MGDFMSAHGSAPGPGQHPVLAGASAAVIGVALAAIAIGACGAAVGVRDAFPSIDPVFLALVALVAGLALGAAYGAIFRRAANDRRGGWLFGISYGFLVWMMGAGGVLRWLVGPLATGTAAIGLMAAHLLYGGAIGVLYPWIHRLFPRRLAARRAS
jgi:hypothetical protein